MRPPRGILKRLYFTERLTTRAIGARFGISKTEVIRCMKRYGMARRPPGHGLTHRGISPPTRDELHSMVHVEHLSYDQIGARYGVDSTAPYHWMRKLGIPRPTIWGTRRKGRVVTVPTPGELRAYYADGLSLEHIGWMHGVSDEPIRLLARRIGLEIRPNGWKQGQRWTCDDGHSARSTYEMRVDNWLHAHGILHRPEPRIPHTAQRRADFWSDGWYIEIWGVINRASYRQRKQEKRAHYKRHGIPLFELSPHDFSSRSPDRWSRKLAATFYAEPQLTLA